MATKFMLAREKLGRVSLAERLLLLFCKEPSASGAQDHPSEADPLARLKTTFPDFPNAIRGKRVVDFGCGFGDQSIALAKLGAGSVVGIDINEKWLRQAREKASGIANVRFATKIDDEFDVIVCQDAFEHLADPEGAMREMIDGLSENGRIFLTFGQPWYAPYGAHCHYFTTLPWVHLFFSERTIHRVMALYHPNPGVSFLEDMNMMSVRRFERIMKNSRDCAFEGLRLHCVREISLFAKIPILRELMINEISCTITKRPHMCTGVNGQAQALATVQVLP